MSAPPTFPRTTWQTGFGPAPFTDRMESSWALYSAQRASKVWAAAETSGDWSQVDATCFKLAVCDKAHEMNYAWLITPKRYTNPDRTFEAWIALVAGYVREAYNLAETSLRRAAQTSEHARHLCGHLPDFERVRALAQAIINIDYVTGGFNPRYSRRLKREPVDPVEFGKFDPNLAWERGELKTCVTTYDWATGKPIGGPELVNPKKRKETADGAPAGDGADGDGHRRPSPPGASADGADGNAPPSPVSDSHTSPGNVNNHRAPTLSDTPPAERGAVEPEELGSAQRPPANVRRISRPRSRTQSPPDVPGPDGAGQLSDAAAASAPDVSGAPQDDGAEEEQRAEEQRAEGGEEQRAEEQRAEGGEEQRAEGGEEQRGHSGEEENQTSIP